MGWRFAMCGSIVFVLVAAGAAGAAGSGWSIQPTPNPSTASSLNAVSCPSGSACAAVGRSDNGTLAERWNGTEWTVQHAPATHTASLGGVSCASARACLAVGWHINSNEAELMLAERWTGSKWTVQHTARPAAAIGSSLAGVSCTSVRACTAVGFYFTRSTTEGERTLAERWNGSKWTVQHTPNPTTKNSFFTGVVCASKSACIAWGSYQKRGAEVTLAERWNGTKWTIQHMAVPTGAKQRGVGGVSCTSARACTAVGGFTTGTGPNAQYVPLAERWNGTKWTIQDIPKPTGATNSGLADVSCASANACSAVGSFTTGAGPNAQYATLAERWNGTKWTIEPTQNPSGVEVSQLIGVSCASRSSCSAVGSQWDGGADTFTLAEGRNGG